MEQTKPGEDIMRWTLIENGEIKQVKTALPETWNNGIQDYPIRRMWGAAKDLECNQLGWFACKEVTPRFDTFVSKVSPEYITELVDGLPISTQVLVDLTKDEIDDLVFDKVTLLRTKVKDLGLEKIQELLPTVNCFDEVGLVSLLWESLESKSESSPFGAVIAIYNLGLAGLLQVDKLTMPDEVTTFNIHTDIIWS